MRPIHLSLNQTTPLDEFRSGGVEPARTIMQETDFLKGNQRVLNDIKKFEIFEPFQDDELQHLMAMSKIRKYNSGETIFAQGSADTWLYFHGLWKSPIDEGQQTGGPASAKRRCLW
jgi:hypothetical protein